MNIVTQQSFNMALCSFATSNFKHHCTYRFVPCIEYSKQFWPVYQYHNKGECYMSYHAADWNGTGYEIGRHQIPNDNSFYPQYFTPDPLADLFRPITNIINKVTNGSGMNELVYVNPPSDIFLEFDFKHRYEDENQRKKLFGDRSELEARQHYYDTINHNSFLLSEMNLISTRKIGDVVRAIKAYEEFSGSTITFDTITKHVEDFVPWLSRNGAYCAYCNDLNESINKEDLKITDFYNIVPDNPSVDDLVKEYDRHKDFIKSIPEKYKYYNGYYDGSRLYHKYLKCHLSNDGFNKNVFLLGVFTRSEFEDMLSEHIIRNYPGFTNVNEFKTQCTIKTMIKVYQDWAAKEVATNPTNKQHCDKLWINTLIKNPDAKRMIVKIKADSSNSNWNKDIVEIIVE